MRYANTNDDLGEIPVSKKNATDPATEKRLRDSYIKHATLAQLHRWWQIYETGAKGVDTHIDVLSHDVHVQSVGSEAKGHQAFIQAVGQLPATWQNAHVMKSHTIDIEPDGTINLSVDLDYFNVGMLPDNRVSKSTVHYEAKLNRTATLLPEISEIVITQLDTTEATSFEDAFIENRIRSLVHHFTALVEAPSRDPEPFREVLADEFTLHYVEPPIADFDSVREWVTGRLSSVVASNHQIHDLSHEVMDNGDYLVTIRMESQALFPDGSGIISKNAQTWVLSDNVSDRFAKIKNITIDRDDVARI